MQRCMTVTVAVILALPTLVAAQSVDSVRTEPNIRPQFSDYAVEALGAYGCGCGLALPGIVAIGLYGLSTMDASEMNPGVEAGLYCLGFGGYALGSAAAANWIGNGKGWSGSFRWSLGLSALTVAVGYGLATGIGYATRNDLSGVGGMATVTVYCACIGSVPLMAVVGYNIGAKRREPLSWENRLAPPSLSAWLEGPREAGERRAVTLDAKLLTVRF